MPIERISTLSLHNRTVSNINSSRAELATLQRYISSGKHIESFPDLARNGDSERLITFESINTRRTAYSTGNKIVLTRLGITAGAIDQIFTVAGELRDLLVQKRNPGIANSIPLAQLAKDKLGIIVDNLNLQSEGRYLFSGSKTDNSPVEINFNNPNLDANGNPTDNYYRGDKVDLEVRANDALSVRYNTRADEPAFQQLIATVFKAIDAESKGSPDHLLAEAVDLVNAAIRDLQTLKSSVDNKIITLNTANLEHEDTQLYIKSILTDITDTDIAKASIDVATQETILQATFQTFARISQLSLSEYLR